MCSCHRKNSNCNVTTYAGCGLVDSIKCKVDVIDNLVIELQHLILKSWILDPLSYFNNFYLIKSLLI